MAKADAAAPGLARAERLKGEGEYAAALKEAAGACAASPGDSQAWRVRAELEELLGDEKAAGRSLARALAAQRRAARARPQAEEWLDLGGLAEDLGRLAEARAAYESAREKGSARAALELARLRLWAARPAEALRLAGDSPERGARRVRAGAAALAGRHEDALAQLDALLAEDPEDREARAWRGEARLALGRAEDALADFDFILHRTDNLLAAGAGHALASLALGRPVRAFDLWVVANQAPPALRPGLLRLRPGDAGVAPALRRLLAALGGNRGPRKTVADGKGGLRAYAPKPTAYDLGEAVQTRLRAGDADAVLARFARLRERLPREPQVLTFRGETLLWLGRADEAERDFRAALALDPTLRWPNVGLAGVETLRGRWEAALARCADAVALGARDRSWRVWAGEACLRLGRPDEAAAHLRAGLAATPRRLSAWMLLALAERARGREQEARALEERCRRGAPAFFAQAARAAGAAPGADLEAGLRLMRGNRSSWLWTWLDPSGRLRNAHFSPEG